MRLEAAAQIFRDHGMRAREQYPALTVAVWDVHPYAGVNTFTLEFIEDAGALSLGLVMLEAEDAEADAVAAVTDC
jgi:hypothetical protein